MTKREPEIYKYPTELFGYPYTEFVKNNENAMKGMNEQYCPYLESKCKKFRKSNPDVKIGTCSLGYKGPMSESIPVVICPHRIEINSVFEDIKNTIFPDNADGDLFQWLSEVDLAGIGSIDYVLVRTDNKKKIKDFCCIELQTNGTTGTPWEAVEDIRKHGKYKKMSYKYGLNLANQYQKTMMQQVFKKGRIIEKWQKHLIFVLQDIGIRYLEKSDASDTSGLKHNATCHIDPTRYIHLEQFSMWWSENMWIPKITDVYSTDMKGVERLLGGQSEKPVIPLEKFIELIHTKLI